MSNSTEFMKSVFWKILEWITRPKNTVFVIGRIFFAGGFGGGILFNSLYLKHSTNDGTITELNFSTDQLPILIQNSLWGFGFIGATILMYEVCHSIKDRNKKFIIGVEHIGLKKRIATSLSSSLKKGDAVPIDLTDCYENDKVSNPKKALYLTIVGIESILKSKAAEIGSNEITIVYGGMAPVGLGFLAGYLMPNTYHFEVWDYNRNAKDGKNWYKIEGYSDANRPIVDFSHYAQDKDVCLLMSISHPVSISQVRSKVSYPSYIGIKLPDIKYDSMSSIEKLKDFENEFAELLKSLAADGTERVHIFCAAQSSFNFSMGRQITRNHPAIIVYEYDISRPEKYPWGVLLNTKDNSSPAIV